MPRALRVCPTSGCHELTPGGRCPKCKTEAERDRGTARDRGYDAHWHNGPRRTCLTRDPLCVCEDAGHGHDGRQCIAPATVADHHPESRRDLIARGVPDPDAPHRLRGICTRCHNQHTATEQPGGWAERHSR